MGRAYFSIHDTVKKNRMLVRTVMVYREDHLGNSREERVLWCDMNVNKQAQSKKNKQCPQKNENEYTQIDVAS